jgi:type IV secretion system protein VirD4
MRFLMGWLFFLSGIALLVVWALAVWLKVKPQQLAQEIARTFMEDEPASAGSPLFREADPGSMGGVLGGMIDAVFGFLFSTLAVVVWVLFTGVSAYLFYLMLVGIFQVFGTSPPWWFVWLIVLVVGIFWSIYFGMWNESAIDMLGRSRWAEMAEVRKSGLFEKKANSIYLGRFQHPAGISTTQEMFSSGDRHWLVIGPNRSGKGVGLLTPNVCALDGSMVIIDPKGELCAQTTRKRNRTGKADDVLVLNPFGLHAANGWPWMKDRGWNPLATLVPGSARFADDVEAVADAIVLRSAGDGKSAHFDDQARGLISMLIGWSCVTMTEHGEVGDLGMVWSWVMDTIGVGKKDKPAMGLTGVCEEILARGVLEDGNKSGVPQFIYNYAKRWAGVGHEELHSAHGTAQRHVNFLGSDELRRSLQGPGFDFRRMLDRKTTVYLVLPVDELETKSRWLRLAVTSALRALLSEPARKLGPVWFIMDEFAALGRLEPVARGMAYAAGMGVRLNPVVQDLNQLKYNYSDRWESFVSSAGVISTFAPQDNFTAEYLSKMFGMTTVMVPQGEHASPQSTNLVNPDDLMRLRANEAVTLVRGVNMGFPIRTFAVPFFASRFNEGIDPNPYRVAHGPG